MRTESGPEGLFSRPNNFFLGLVMKVWLPTLMRQQRETVCFLESKNKKKNDLEKNCMSKE